MTITLINFSLNSISNIAILIIWLGLTYLPGLGQFSSYLSSVHGGVGLESIA